MHSFIDKKNDITIFHNGDFSGDCLLIVKDEAVEIFNNEHSQIRIPCEALLAFVSDYIRSEKISKLENMTIKELLLGDIA